MQAKSAEKYSVANQSRADFNQSIKSDRLNSKTDIVGDILLKEKIKKSIFSFSNVVKRWFVLDFKCKVFYYKESAFAMKIKKKIPFKDIKNFCYEDGLKYNGEWRHAVRVETINRPFTLYFDST